GARCGEEGGGGGGTAAARLKSCMGMVYRAIMAPFLRRPAPSRQGAKGSPRSEEAASACGSSRVAFAPPRAGRSGAFASPQRWLTRYFIAASYILATYSQLTR